MNEKISRRLLASVLIVLLVISVVVNVKALKQDRHSESWNDPASLSWRIEAITEEISELSAERDRLIERQIELLRQTDYWRQ